MVSRCFDKLIKLLLFISLMPVAVLTAASLFRSEEFELGMDVERLVYEKDHPLLLLLCLAALLAALSVLKRSAKNKFVLLRDPKTRNSDRYIVMAAAGLISLFFLLVLRSQPYMDCKELISVANRFSRNVFYDLSTPEHNSYLFIYAFQIGMVSLLEILFRLFGENNYFSFQLLNVLFAAIMAGSLHEIAAVFCSDEHAIKLADIFICLCLPLYINVTFVYGDVIGWSLASCALMHVIKWSEDNRRIRLVISAFLISAGILIKSNDYIILIAMILILLIDSIRKKDRIAPFFALLWIASSLLLTSSVKAVYARRAGIEAFPSGAPATCWIAMSMIEHKDFEDGWYNGYNITTFVESGYDPSLANEIATEKIKERIELFVKHPRYTARFFLTKFISAWNDPQFNSQIKMEWSTRHVEEPYPLAVSLVEGRGRQVLFCLMNILHFLIFAGSFIWLIYCVKGRGKKDLSRRTAYLTLSFLGGVAFHLLWETQSRYMIPYYLYLFPTAASGLVTGSDSIFSMIHNRKGIKQ